MTAAPILQVEGLRLALPPGADRPLALAGLDLTVAPGEVVCLVGESGSGKSLAANAILRLLPPQVQATGGRILLDGEDVATKTEAEMRACAAPRPR